MDNIQTHSNAIKRTKRDKKNKYFRANCNEIQYPAFATYIDRRHPLRMEPYKYP